MIAETGWLTPPAPITGLDHLGTQAPCIALYSELLPGITNVTDRARYFSFHPWFIWSFEQKFADHSELSYAQEVRRADCLMTLVAIRHREVTSGSTEAHDVAAVGSRALGAAYAGLSESTALALDDYAAFQSDTRYFKSRWGGLGQYYIGSLLDLRLIDYVPGGVAIPGYDRTRGLALARAFDASVPSDRFFQVLRARTITTADLDALAPFCMCRLKANADEQSLLLDVLLARRPNEIDDGGPARRDSLGLLLHVVQTARPKDLQWELRPGAYTGHLPARSPWSLSPRLERARQRWGVYHKNELLSMAVQGIFWSILQAMHERRRGVVRNAREAGDVLVALVRETRWRNRLGEKVQDVLRGERALLPSVGAWDEPSHEHQRALRIEKTASRFQFPPEGLQSTIEDCVGVLVTLLARAGDAASFPYSDFELPVDRFGGEEVDLASLQNESARWFELSVEEWARWLAENWCIRRHLNVALRKLRADGRDTFRVRPLDDGLRLVEVAPASFTGPRVDRAQQLLFDLGLIDRDPNDGRLNLTPLGARELEAISG